MTFGELRFALITLIPDASPDAIDQAINNRIESISRHLRWKALEADACFVTTALWNQGTVTVTNGDTHVTLAGGMFPNDVGRRFRVLGRKEFYVFTYVDSTHGTLDRNYEGDTATGAPYQLWQNVYALPADYAGPVGDAANQRLGVELRYADHATINQMDPARLRVGEPFHYAEASPAASGARQAELYPVPQYAASYPFRYVRTIARYAATDTALSIPAWLSIPCLMAGVRADLAHDQTQAVAYEYELSQMRKQDASARGIQKLRMAPTFTRHRLERVLRNQRMRLT